MEREQVQTRTATIGYEEDGILCVTIYPGAEEDLADAHKNIGVVTKLMGSGRRSPMLIDMRKIKSQSREARDYYGSPQVLQLSPAVALLVESRVSALIANFFVSVTARERATPLRIFTNRAEAEAWLKGFLQ